MTREDLDRLRNEFADKYSANHRHLSTRQHCIDAWNARDRLDLERPEVLALVKAVRLYDPFDEKRCELIDQALAAYDRAKGKT